LLYFRDKKVVRRVFVPFSCAASLVAPAVNVLADTVAEI
jgi:hypothetical protein